MKRAWGLVSLILISALATPAARSGTGTVLAVFDIEDTREGRAKLSTKKLRSLTDYLATKLGVGGKFEVVPRDSVRKAIAEKKKESHKECYDESCQIEIGKEIAAQKSLATKVDQMGGECLVTATLYDLRKGATENSASYRGPCGHSELLTAIEQIAFKLRGEKPSQASKKGIRFDTTSLPTVPTLSMPSDSDSASSGMDFGDVDVATMELLDSAIQADKDKNLPIKEKISRWQAVKKKAPKYRKQATAKIVAWKQYQRKKLEIDKIHKKRAAKMMKDWNKLSRLLKLKMISDEDKEAWQMAFYESYGKEAETNPFVKNKDVLNALNRLKPLVATLKRSRELKAELKAAYNKAKENKGNLPGQLAALEGFLRKYPNDNPYLNTAQREIRALQDQMDRIEPEARGWLILSVVPKVPKAAINLRYGSSSAGISGSLHQISVAAGKPIRIQFKQSGKTLKPGFPSWVSICSITNHANTA